MDDVSFLANGAVFNVFCSSKSRKNCHALTVSDLRSKIAARSFIRDKVARFMMEMKATKKIYFVRLESGDAEVDPDEGNDE